MTDDDTQHVLDAIDHALWDWDEDEMPDAMRWRPDGFRDGPLRTIPEGWTEVGYTTEDGGSFASEARDEMLRYGSVMVSVHVGADGYARGVRVVPQGATIRGLRAQFVTIDEGQLAEVGDTFSRVTVALREAMLPAAERMMARFKTFSEALRTEPPARGGILPDRPDRDRSLAARQQRSTGPRHNPFQHRGRGRR